MKKQNLSKTLKHTRRHFIKSFRWRFPETERVWGLFLSFPVFESPYFALFLCAFSPLFLFCTTLYFAISELFPCNLSKTLTLTEPFNEISLLSFGRVWDGPRHTDLCRPMFRKLMPKLNAINQKKCSQRVIWMENYVEFSSGWIYLIQWL